MILTILRLILHWLRRAGIKAPIIPSVRLRPSKLDALLLTPQELQAQRLNASNAPVLIWLLGAYLTIQGLGNALSDHFWHSDWGLSRMLIQEGLPHWINWALGLAGLILLLVQWQATGHRKAQP